MSSCPFAHAAAPLVVDPASHGNAHAETMRTDDPIDAGALPDVAPPASPLAAVTHVDPYPYYRTLAHDRPFDLDADTGLWIAASPAAVEQVLQHPACRVRPVDAPVPAALRGTVTGDWFARLMRMTDGARHDDVKPAWQTRLATLPADEHCVARLFAAADAALTDAGGASTGDLLDDYAFRQPIYALAAWLGVPDDEWSDVFAHTRAVVGAMATAAAAAPAVDTLRAGERAIVALHGHARRWLRQGTLPDGWPGVEARHDVGRQRPVDDEVSIANLIGLFTQTHDATAGLLANTLRHLARRTAGDDGLAPFARAAVDDSPINAATAAVVHVLRHDPPVHNTRRFLAEPAVIAQRTLRRGDTVLVVLAAAQVSDDARRIPWTFGAHGHACPGHSAAVTLASVGVAAVQSNGLALAPLAQATGYHALPNIRIARFGAAA